MTIAYILINSEVGSENTVLNNLGKISEIKEAHTVNGLYDIIALVETKTILELDYIINSKIRKLGNIRSTLTMVTS